MAKAPVVTEQPSADTLGQAIVKISKAAESLARTGINRKAVLILLAHHSGESQRVVGIVLNSLEDLARTYGTKS